MQCERELLRSTHDESSRNRAHVHLLLSSVQPVWRVRRGAKPELVSIRHAHRFENGDEVRNPLEVTGIHELCVGNGPAVGDCDDNSHAAADTNVELFEVRNTIAYG